MRARSQHLAGWAPAQNVVELCESAMFVFDP